MEQSAGKAMLSLGAHRPFFLGQNSVLVYKVVGQINFTTKWVGW